MLSALLGVEDTEQGPALYGPPLEEHIGAEEIAYYIAARSLSEERLKAGLGTPDESIEDQIAYHERVICLKYVMVQELRNKATPELPAILNKAIHETRVQLGDKGVPYSTFMRAITERLEREHAALLATIRQVGRSKFHALEQMSDDEIEELLEQKRTTFESDEPNGSDDNALQRWADDGGTPKPESKTSPIAVQPKQVNLYRLSDDEWLAVSGAGEYRYRTSPLRSDERQRDVQLFSEDGELAGSYSVLFKGGEPELYIYIVMPDHVGTGAAEVLLADMRKWVFNGEPNGAIKRLRDELGIKSDADLYDISHLEPLSRHLLRSITRQYPTPSNHAKIHIGA